MKVERMLVHAFQSTNSFNKIDVWDHLLLVKDSTSYI